MSSRARITCLWIAGIAIFFTLAIIDLFTGSANLSGRDICDALLAGPAADGNSALTIIWKIRLPRILTAVIAGSGLAICGTQMQALFRNPLADPHILGISAGAGTGAAIASAVAGFTTGSAIGMTAAAATGALIMSMIILGISSRVRSSSVLLITGVMAGFVMSALTSMIEYQASESQLKMYWNWAAGSFSGNTWSGIGTMACCLVTGSMLAAVVGKGLSAMLFGEEYAESAGVRTGRTRALSMLSCCLITGSVTAFCGPIGFIGIVAPHIVRAFSGKSSMQTVLPLSLICGAILSLAGDILSMIWSTPLPAGSTIAFLGIPVIFLILRNKRIL